MRRTREYRGPGRGHDGTVDTPAAESEPPEDRDIHWAKSPTPATETFTRAGSTPPSPTPSHPATTFPAPTPSLPHDTRNPTHSSKLPQGDLGIPAPQMQPIRPTRPAPNHTTSLNPRPTLPPTWERPSRPSQHMNWNILATSPLCFSRHPKNSRLHIHASKTYCILLPFRVSDTLPRCLIFFTFSCSYPLYNSHQFLVPPYFGAWYSLLLESRCQLRYLSTSR